MIFARRESVRREGDGPAALTGPGTSVRNGVDRLAAGAGGGERRQHSPATPVVNSAAPRPSAHSPWGTQQT